MKQLLEKDINSKKYWDTLYTKEIKESIPRVNRDRFEIMLDLLPPLGEVLEIGCGKGEFYEALSLTSKRLEYTGIDISSVAVEYNKKKYSSVKFQTTPEILPMFAFQSNSFDAVFTIEVLEHIEKLPAFIKEVKRVLKPGGRFLSILPNEEHIKSSEHYWSLSLEDINKLFAGGGNTITESENYIIIDWQKKELVFDFDDFSEKNNRMDLLNKLKEAIPELKVTLFTIPNDCTKEFCQRINQIDWIDLALHGDKHTHLECAVWTKEQTNAVLDKYEQWGVFKKIFKPPFWEGTEEMNQVLAERGYVLAQNKKISNYTGKLYIVNSNSVHGHIHNACDNGLEEKFDYYKSLKGHNYKFINELYA